MIHYKFKAYFYENPVDETFDIYANNMSEAVENAHNIILKGLMLLPFDVSYDIECEETDARYTFELQLADAIDNFSCDHIDVVKGGGSIKIMYHDRHNSFIVYPEIDEDSFIDITDFREIANKYRCGYAED